MLLGQLNWTLAQLLSNYQREMPAAAWEKFQTNVKKMCQGYPPQYLLGSTSFYGLKLQVTPATLIPRPDTEELVDFILTDWNRHRGDWTSFEVKQTKLGCKFN